MSQYTQSVQRELNSGSHSATANYTAVASGAILIANPGYHKSIFLTDLNISNGDTAGYFRIFEGGSAVNTVIIERQNLAIDRLSVLNFAQALQLTPNNNLLIYSDTADDFSVTVNYYIDEVKGFGYSSGGDTGSYTNVIGENFFASDSNSTDLADLTVARALGAGQSSAVSGYNSGGTTGSNTDVIDKFSFSSDGDATDVGDLSVARKYCGGQQSN